MKQLLPLILTLLMCLTLLPACAKTPPVETETPPAGTEAETPPAGTEAETPPAGAETPSVLTYEIERTDASEGLPVSMFFEIPVFAGESDAAREINAVFAEAKRVFLEDEAPGVRDFVREAIGGEYGPTADAPYQNERTASVFTCDETLVSAAIAYNWYMGGVADYGVDTYNFDAATGALLTLRDLLPLSDDELRETIVAAMLEQYPEIEDAGVTETPMDAVRAKPVESFRFYVEDGAVHVCFNKYEITYGAAGAFDVTLPLAPAR